MRPLIAFALFVIAGVALARGTGLGEVPVTEVSVLEHGKRATRDGHYVDAAFTRAAAARVRLNAGFHAPLLGPVYAQPLFWAAERQGAKDLIIVTTERNQVSALDASTGTPVWQRTIGPPVARRDLPCGNIDPLGITGTPIIDRRSRTLYVAAMTTPDGGRTKQHVVAALSIDDGSMRPGWPINVSTVRAGAVQFNAEVQNQRGALALLDGVLYVPYGGHFGDCGDYHGWVVAVPIDAPASAKAWATRGRGGGIWAPGGVVSDGRAMYVATGNTFGASAWSDGEAILRVRPGPSVSGEPADFFAPTNWRALDAGDVDLGGTAPVLLDVPNGAPTRLVIALGKDGRAYVIDRTRMDGIGDPLTSAHVSEGAIITSAASYATARGSYVVFKGRGRRCPGDTAGDLIAIRVETTSPPAVTVAWCAEQRGAGSPIVTTTDGRSEPIVWSVGAEGDNRLHGFDGDTGQVVFGGGEAADRMSRVRRYQRPIVARGRIFVAGDDQLYEFTTR